MNEGRADEFHAKAVADNTVALPAA